LSKKAFANIDGLKNKMLLIFFGAGKIKIKNQRKRRELL